MIENELCNDEPRGLKKLQEALERVRSGGTNRRGIDFKEAYPVVEQHLAAGLSQKALLEQFNAAYGYAMHPPQFRKMLEAERKLRSENGDPVACAACGQELHEYKQLAAQADDAS